VRVLLKRFPVHVELFSGKDGQNVLGHVRLLACEGVIFNGISQVQVLPLVLFRQVKVGIVSLFIGVNSLQHGQFSQVRFKDVSDPMEMVVPEGIQLANGQSSVHIFFSFCKLKVYFLQKQYIGLIS
jgi:hypothetical protein